MKNLPGLLLAALLLTGCAGWRGDADVAPPFELTLIDLESGKLGSGAAIAIDNPWGDIRVRRLERPGQVVIRAAVQRIGTEFPDRPEFDEDKTQEGYALEVRFPGGWIRGGERNARVDLMVYVPDGHLVQLRTEDGSIRTRKTRLEVEAYSRSGDLSILNDGPVDAVTVLGSIDVRPMRSGWGRLVLEAEKGRVLLFLPSPDAVDIRLENAPSPGGPLVFRSIGPRQWRRGPESGTARDHVRVGSAARVEIYPVELSNPGAAVPVSGSTS